MWRMLRRRFSSQRCLALMLLCVGEILVHYDLSTPAPTLSSSNTTVFECISEVHPDPTVNDVESKNILHDREFLQQCVSSPVATTNSRIHQSHALGLMAALGTCIGSGFAG